VTLILAAFDAILRLQAWPIPSPVSAFFHAPSEAVIAVLKHHFKTSASASSAAADASNGVSKPDPALALVDPGVLQMLAESMGTTKDDPMVQAMALSMLDQEVVASVQEAAARNATAEASATSAEPAPTLGDQPPTALPSSKPAFFLCDSTFLKTDLSKFTPNLLGTAPAAAVAREGAIAYFKAMPSHGAKKMFDYPKNWRFNKDSPEIQLITYVQRTMLLMCAGADQACGCPSVAQVHHGHAGEERREAAAILRPAATARAQPTIVCGARRDVVRA